MTKAKTNSSAMKARAARNMDRIREEFKTCEYPNSGAYADIPTKRGKLEERFGSVTDEDSRCSYWAMVDKGRTSYPYEEHWRDCDFCQKRDPNRVEHRIATADSRQADKVRWEYEQGLDAPEHDPAEKGQATDG